MITKGNKPFQRTAILFLVALIIGLVTAFHLTAAETDPLKIKWMTNEEMGKELFTIPVQLPVDAGPRLKAYVDTKNLSGNGWDRLINATGNLTYADLRPAMSAEDPALDWFYRALSTNTSPVIRFFSLCVRVWGLGDAEAATELAALGKFENMSAQDKWKLENCFHGIGIDPQRDDAKEILRFLSAMRKGKSLRPNPGSPAPDFEISTFDGKKIHLSDYKGKVVLLHFWGTTCGPCIAEFPRLQEELKDWKKADPDFVAIGVALDDSLEDLNKFLKKYDLNWINTTDGRGWGGQAAKRYYINGIPSDVVIDRDGNVAGYFRQIVDGLIGSKKSPKSKSN